MQPFPSSPRRPFTRFSLWASLVLLLLSACATMGSTVRNVLSPAPPCLAYVTNESQLVCGDDLLFLCTSTSACEARIVEQLFIDNAPLQTKISLQDPEDSDESDDDATILGTNSQVKRWYARSAKDDVLARLDVVTPDKQVNGWAAAACYSRGDAAVDPHRCRQILATFTSSSLFPVARMQDVIAPPPPVSASSLPRVGRRGIFFDPSVCLVEEQGFNGQVQCPNVSLSWRRSNNTHDANTVASEVLSAFRSTSTIVRSRSLKCSIAGVSTTCEVLDARRENTVAGHITAFARLHDGTYTVSCTWTGSDTIRPAPLCAAFFDAEGLSPANVPSD